MKVGGVPMDETRQYIWEKVIPDIDKRIKQAAKDMVNESDRHGYGDAYIALRQDFRDLKSTRYLLIACAGHNYFHEMEPWRQ